MFGYFCLIAACPDLPISTKKALPLFPKTVRPPDLPASRTLGIFGCFVSIKNVPRRIWGHYVEGVLRLSNTQNYTVVVCKSYGLKLLK